MSRSTPIGRPCRAALSAGASVIVLFAAAVACGPSEDERIAVARDAAWAELLDDQAALNAKREELAQLRARVAAPGEEDDVEALAAEADALDSDVGNDSDAFSTKLANYINEAGWELDGEMTEEQRAAFAMNSGQAMYLAEEYVVKGGDYRRATEILEGALVNDSDNADLQARLAEYQDARYITAERLAQVKQGMTEAEVEGLLGKVYHRNVREFDEEKVFAWFYPKNPEEHGDGAAAGVFFRMGDLKVYRTDADAVEGKRDGE